MTMGDAIAIVDDAYYLLFVRGGGSGKVGLVFTKSGTGTVATYIQFSIVLLLKNEKGTSELRPT